MIPFLAPSASVRLKGLVDEQLPNFPLAFFLVSHHTKQLLFLVLSESILSWTLNGREEIETRVTRRAAVMRVAGSSTRDDRIERSGVS